MLKMINFLLLLVLGCGFPGKPESGSDSNLYIKQVAVFDVRFHNDGRGVEVINTLMCTPNRVILTIEPGVITLITSSGERVFKVVQVTDNNNVIVMDDKEQIFGVSLYYTIHDKRKCRVVFFLGDEYLMRLSECELSCYEL